jgi:hypothetical protein
VGYIFEEMKNALDGEEYIDPSGLEGCDIYTCG